MTIDEQIACVEREIRMRARVYPRWVAEGRMTQAEHDLEIAAMHAVLRTLAKVKEQEAAQMGLPL